MGFASSALAIDGIANAIAANAAKAKENFFNDPSLVPNSWCCRQRRVTNASFVANTKIMNRRSDAGHVRSMVAFGGKRTSRG